MTRLRRHLTYANVISTLCLFLLLGGGSAYALTGTNTVFSDDIVNGEVKSFDIATGAVRSPKIADGQVLSADVGNELLTGQDIKDKSGVDTCPSSTLRFGDICAGGPGVVYQSWYDADRYCRDLKLRLPTLGEASTLAANYDVPGVGSFDIFWTDDVYYNDQFWAVVATEDADALFVRQLTDTSPRTVCVTTPTN
jgi:hypothetical protein